MKTTPVTAEDLAASVIAVPPLARGADLSPDRRRNAELIRHIEGGGVRILLYGGNANLYHVPLSAYEPLLAMLEELAGERTAVIPSAGPAWGMMMDQASILRGADFPAVMVLPHQGVTDDEGVASGLRRFAEAAGMPLVLYLKFEGYLDVEGVRRLVDDGLVAWIKYAVVRDDPRLLRDDPYLRRLTEAVDPRMIVSGMGEQPAIVHLRDFGLAGFTSGCVCVAPGLSMAMLRAAKAGDWDEAERIRALFEPLEDLRNAISPIRVLHDAVAAAGIAETGPLTPLLSNLAAADRRRVERAAKELLAVERCGRAGIAGRAD